MPAFLKKIIDTVKNIWDKTGLTQKLIAGAVILAFVVGIILLFSFNSGRAGVSLFSKALSEEDFERITAKLAEEKIQFTSKNRTNIYVKSQNEKNRAVMLLAEDGSIPKGSYTFKDIINSKNLTSSRFLNSVKLREALEGKLEKLLKASELIDSADVTFTMPEQTIYLSEKEPVKVAVMLTPAYKVDLKENKRAIKGIQELVVNSIDGATAEYVTITDNYGVKLNDFSDEEDINRLKITKDNLKTRNEIVENYRRKIIDALSKIISNDRLSLVVDVSMNFDQERENTTELLPVILKEDDPNTPYDDGERKYSVTISRRTTNETFEGPNWIPEGPPGFDDNVPPAYKGALEQMTKYIKNDEILNEATGERKRETIRDPWEITKITASVAVDGKWEIEYDAKNKPILNPDGSRKRKYIPVPKEELRSLKGFVEQGIGFSVERNDKVEVYEYPKDRAAQFAEEDAKWKRKQQTTMALFAGLIALIVLILATIIYRLIAKEIERRKRLREEELARQHQLAREIALKSAEEEGVEVEMSMEDKARLEMQENAINMAREHPEDVAQLIRTWLSEE
ncbi:MAG TPA: flagellar basal-body MS-ring/collar protein FliF [Spirochaetota bacterium]|nr:flagellar basal-body MS-ring/collar protein FliF [Spirochaetota bacterium]HOF00772.1 flagellar basal-body MS-ring/collar protein FliF [Spirochaetota bacterium]HOS32451.1 flagellar basal-body MS-ring/collar protein FliF [Spirochaetota bacterium]HOS55886.1 flagellar basal-body MS-ring/collar protein FliF [Spirochaetota bacterium]HQF77468.1 flagellar basal-body MS-ring/collar protein FliF [Spirochaetota bacterium]